MQARMEQVERSSPHSDHMINEQPVPYDASGRLWRDATQLTDADVDARGRRRAVGDAPKIAPSVRRAERQAAARQAAARPSTMRSVATRHRATGEDEVARLRRALTTALRHNHLLEAALRLSESRAKDSRTETMLLTRYEVARIVGLRALQLDQGAPPLVRIEDERLRCDALYVAARELEARALDAKVRRAGDVDVHVRDARLPPELHAMLDTKDGQSRDAYSSDS